MKILIINKFLYPRGGDCICALNLGELLKANGHDVCYFAMDYSENISFNESSNFPEEVSFSSPGINGKLKAVSRILNGGGVVDKYSKVLDSFKPDVVHLHNIHSYLSPIVAKLANKKGIKVVWTLHDYKLICPSYSCLNNGEICEACFDNKWNVLVKKCMKGSLIASSLAYAEAIRWNREKLMKWTDMFICPSQFMASKMGQGGFDKGKLSVLCNFIENEKVKLINTVNAVVEDGSYCYIGRLSHEKGIENLLEVASTLPYKLYVAGDGPLKEELIAKYASEQIVFLGHLNKTEIVELFKKVHFSVIPSVWYENNPLSVIESLCCGTPVLGANIGGIPELLMDENCDTFTYDDKNDLKDKIITMFEKYKNIDKQHLSNKSVNRFSDLSYYEKLLKIYQESSCQNIC